MPQLPAPFDPNQYDPTQSAGGQLPIGKHVVVIESSEVKATQDNTGGYIQLNLKITEGPQAGLTGAYRLNLYHAKDVVKEIAQKQFTAVCYVCGVFTPINQTEPIHNIPFMVEVGPQKNKPEYTEVKKVFDVGGNEPGKGGQAAAAPAPAAAPGAPAAAWGGNNAAAAPAQPAAPAAGQPAWGGAAPAQPAAPAPAAPATPAPAAPAPQAGAPVPWGAPQ